MSLDIWRVVMCLCLVFLGLVPVEVIYCDACGMTCGTVADRMTEAVTGYYQVRAIDYWSRPSAFSRVVRYPAT